MSRRGIVLTLTAFALSSTLMLAQTNKLTKAQEDAAKREKEGNYLKKWPDQEVPYIINSEEGDVFKKLKTDEERESFIEAFWFRRDPSPDTLDNEYRDEYYRRIAVANEKFTSGIPGWKTDRGRIFIMHGEADEVQTYAMGGTYIRDIEEGGGRTSTFPFERWRYRHIEGMGNNIILEFVDSSMSGEYRLEYDPNAKDALLHVPGVGLTEYEERNGLDKADRLNRDFAMAGTPFGATTGRRSQFDMLEDYYRIQQAPTIKYADLSAIVTAKVSYNVLPFNYRADLLNLTENEVMVPITVQVPEKSLSFKEEYTQDGTKGMRAVGKISGQIVDLTGKTVRRWDDTFEVVRLAAQMNPDAVHVYQKVLYMQPKLYRLFLVVNDLKSNHNGTLDTRLALKRFPDGNLDASSLILADLVEPLPPRAVETAWRIGNLKVRPNVTRVFRRETAMNVFAQIYNLKLDETTHKPSVETEILISRDGQEVRRIVGDKAELASAAQQMNFIKEIPMKDLEPGQYSIQVKITDKLAGLPVVLNDKFTVR
jgi:GWxTD domain-containing protein